MMGNVFPTVTSTLPGPGSGVAREGRDGVEPRTGKFRTAEETSLKFCNCNRVCADCAAAAGVDFMD